MEFKKISNPKRNKTPRATLSYGGRIYLNKYLVDKIGQYDYTEIYYACSDKGLIVVLKLLNEPTRDAYKIHKRPNHGYIVSRYLGDLMITKPSVKTSKVEFKGNEVWLYFEEVK